MNLILPITIILLRFVAFYSFFDSANIVFSCAIRGAGDTMFTMIITIISTIALSCAIFLAINFFHVGLLACWTIATAYISLMGLAFFFRFRNGKWKKMKIIESKTP